MVQKAEAYEIEDENARTGKARAASRSKSEDERKSSSDEKEKRERGQPRSRSVGKEEQGGGKVKKELPCRISVKVSAVEAFVYNRSPLYDSVLEQTLKRAKSPPDASGGGAAVAEEPRDTGAGATGGMDAAGCGRRTAAAVAAEGARACAGGLGSQWPVAFVTQAIDVVTVPAST